MDQEIDLLDALGYVAFEQVRDSVFRPVSRVPGWLADRFPELSATTFDFGAVFPIIESLLVEAEPVWCGQADRRVGSGPWTQLDANGQPSVLEATAALDGHGRRVIVVRLLGIEFAERQQALQESREQRLAYENLHQVHAALAESARQTQRMADERRTAIEMLRQTRIELEDRIAERTVALVEANARLREEAARREQSNADLLRHQERLRALADRILVAEEDERRRVAEFVHDQIGQNLALLKMQLHGMRKDVAGEATSSLHQAEQLTDAIIADSRRVTANLGTPVLYELGVVGAVADLVTRFEEAHGIQAHCEDDGRDKPLAQNVKLFVYQAIRELLHNVAKHARARQVTVSLRREGSGVMVTVADQGAGFDPEQDEQVVTPSGGFGLFNIRERAIHLGGVCHVRTRRGFGTEVVITLPLAQER
ncbi:MAG: ATP-binding protein [Planctomycetes bacterium]|nr:ATP-binding protein [Planctomycetota bacterium]